MLEFGKEVVLSSRPFLFAKLTTVYVSRKKERGFCCLLVFFFFFFLRTVSRRFSLLLYFIITSFMFLSALLSPLISKSL